MAKIQLSKQLQAATGEFRFNMTNDVMFKMVLQKDEKILRGLISSMMHIPIEEIKSAKVLNPESFKDTAVDKVFVLDIKVKLNKGSVINLEMQAANQYNWQNRSLSYLCRNFDSLQKGKEYNSVDSAIHIGFLDFDLFPEYPEFYASYMMTNVKKHYVYNDKFVLNVLSLSQIGLATEEDKAWGIDTWARMFKAKTYEEVKAMASISMEMAMVAENIYNANTDEMTRERLRLREEYIRHEKWVNKQLEEKSRLEAEIKDLAKENKCITGRYEKVAAEKEELAEKIKALEAELERAKNQ